MVKAGIGQQQVVDAGEIKTEGLGIFLTRFPPALVRAAVDKNAFAGALAKMAGAGNTATGAVERNFQRLFLSSDMY